MLKKNRITFEPSGNLQFPFKKGLMYPSHCQGLGIINAS